MLMRENKGKNKAKSHAPRNIPKRRSLLGRALIELGYFITKTRTNWQVFGKEHIPQGEPYVIIANHVTFIDALWILKALPKEDYANTCAMIGADLKSDYGLLGKLMTEAARAIPVDRKGTAAARSLIIAKNALEAGNNILIHPEGTRSKTGKIQKFQTGAAYLGYKYNAPILPVYIKGGYDIWPRGQKLPRFKDKEKRKKKDLRLFFFPAIRDSQASFKDVKEMSRYLQKKYEEVQAELGL